MSEQIARWKGKLLEDMTREELIAALRQSATMYSKVITDRVFRGKPIGAPYSLARQEQEARIAIEDMFGKGYGE